MTQYFHFAGPFNSREKGDLESWRAHFAKLRIPTKIITGSLYVSIAEHMAELERTGAFMESARGFGKDEYLRSISNKAIG